MYIDGVNVTTIEAETRIDKATTNKLVAKCCKIHRITTIFIFSSSNME